MVTEDHILSTNQTLTRSLIHSMISVSSSSTSLHTTILAITSMRPFVMEKWLMVIRITQSMLIMKTFNKMEAMTMRMRSVMYILKDSPSPLWKSKLKEYRQKRGHLWSKRGSKTAFLLKSGSSKRRKGRWNRCRHKISKAICLVRAKERVRRLRAVMSNQ